MVPEEATNQIHATLICQSASDFLGNFLVTAYKKRATPKERMFEKQSLRNRSPKSSEIISKMVFLLARVALLKLPRVQEVAMRRIAPIVFEAQARYLC
jgi:hypothetical protein